MVKEIKNSEEFVKAIGDDKTGLVVIDFFADWCMPCRNFAPKFEELERKYLNTSFYKLNIELLDNRNAVHDYEIRSLPTFCLFRNGKYLTRVMGANGPVLDDLIFKKN